MTTTRFGFIDVMKCLAMALIVFGHVGAYLTAGLTPPVYQKQLGVAFFLFLTGFTLARERRPAAEVVYRRLFEVILVGVAFAMLMSAITFQRIADLAESNYLPFLLGANVTKDNFPANPTTWFIGTYIHVLVVWAFALRGKRLRISWLIAAVLAEVLTRGMLIASGTVYIAYMLLPNWATVFLVGIGFGQRLEDGSPRPQDRVWSVLGLAVMLTAWPFLAWRLLDPSAGFPFMIFRAGPRAVALGLTSASVTIVYLAFTLCTYGITRPMAAPAWVRFCSRNTPLVFVAHMPLYYGLQGPVSTLGVPRVLKVTILFLVCFFGPALMSEALRRWLPLADWRDRLWLKLSRSPGVVKVEAVPKG
jgi:hypothetical protein